MGTKDPFVVHPFTKDDFIKMKAKINSWGNWGRPVDYVPADMVVYDYFSEQLWVDIRSTLERKSKL